MVRLLNDKRRQGKARRNFILAVFGLISLSFTIAEIDSPDQPQSLPQIVVDSIGNAVTSYQLELPAGSKGIAPNLNLSYNSSAGEGNFGKGWEMGIGHSIERDPRGSLYLGTETYISSLSGQLVKDKDVFYRSNPESLFYYQKYDANTWIGKDKNGLIYTYGGSSSNSKVTSDLNPSIVQKWYLTSVKDKLGNGYTLEYGQPEGSFGQFVTKVSYLNREILFQYIKKGDDSIRYPNFFKTQDNLVVSQVTIKVGGETIRSYSFEYSGNGYNQKILTKISREESNNFGNAKYLDLVLSYNKETPIQVEPTKELRLDNFFAMSRVPLKDKSECISGTLVCGQYSLMTCNQPNPASLLACQSAKEGLRIECQKFQNTWFIPCAQGSKSANNLLSFGDTDGDGKVEAVRLVGYDDASNLRIVSVKNLDSSMNQTTLSSSFPSINYLSFSTMS